MRAAFAIAALVGAAIAAPSYGKPAHVRDVHVVVDTVVKTVYVMDGAPTPTPAPAAQPVFVAPAKDADPTPTPKPTPTPAPTPAAPANDYMGVVEFYRQKMGMSDLTYDSQLESNCLDTVQSSNGQMIHKLNIGTLAQVLAPGQATRTGFEKCFAGAWLCEMKDLPGLEDTCPTWGQGWSYNGQTGHAAILTSKSYSKIGCANFAGIWGCDLA
ncbi:hypothetical protein ACEQ8H_007111 [Pleosporales sp. CAS-2024a]